MSHATIEAMRRALKGAQQSAHRADQAAKHCVGGEDRRAQLRKSADELATHARALERGLHQVEDLLAYARQARAALNQNATYPADLALARSALDEGLAPFSTKE